VWNKKTRYPALHWLKKSGYVEKWRRAGWFTGRWFFKQLFDFQKLLRSCALARLWKRFLFFSAVSCSSGIFMPLPDLGVVGYILGKFSPTGLGWLRVNAAQRPATTVGEWPSSTTAGRSSGQFPARFSRTDTG